MLNVDHYLLELNSKLDTLSMNLEALRSKLEELDANLLEHKQDTSAELAQLQTSLTNTRSSLATHTQQVNTRLSLLTTSLSQHDEQTAAKLAQLQTSLTNTLTANTAQLSTDHQHIQTSISDMECMDTEDSNHLTQQLETIGDRVDRLYDQRFTCGGTGGWRRVVYLDMTDPSTICPSGWQLTEHSMRTCGIVSTHSYAPDSVIFPVSGGEYSRVCGRIKAYQHGPTDAFETYHDGDVTTIDGAYVAGVSLTHGTPRRHIWTFAAGLSEALPTRRDGDQCPCDASITIRVPPFVGNDYFCESGVNAGERGGFHPDDPLWDGQNCISSSTCCSFNTPPYFVKQLPTSTTDSIEARLCRLDSGDDSPVELIELYVQ